MSTNSSLFVEDENPIVRFCEKDVNKAHIGWDTKSQSLKTVVGTSFSSGTCVENLNLQQKTKDMGGFKLTNVAEPSQPTDATTKKYVDTAVIGVRKITNVEISTLKLTSGEIKSTAPEINLLSGSTSGKVQPNKAIIADDSRNVSGLNKLETSTLVVAEQNILELVLSLQNAVNSTAKELSTKLTEIDKRIDGIEKQLVEKQKSGDITSKELNHKLNVLEKRVEDVSSDFDTKTKNSQSEHQKLSENYTNFKSLVAEQMSDISERLEDLES